MLRRFVLPLTLALGAQSCLIYDRALLDEAQGGNSNPGLGGSVGDGDGDGDTVGSGGDAGSGGNSGSGGKAETSGGADAGSGGEGSTGGASTGGASATGGTDGSGTCDTTTGSKEDFSDIVDELTLDDFSNEWSSIGEGDRFTGQWNVSQDGTGTDLVPTRTPEDNWSYEHDPCFEGAGDNAMHITGIGYSGWGAGYDANLMLTGLGTSVADYDGVAFWARSSEANQIRLAFSDEATEAPVETSLKLLKQTWTEYKVPFPVGIDKTKLKVVHIVVAGAASFDVWLDDFVFYAE